MAINCFKCGKALSDTYKVMVSRSDTCSGCMSDLKCCKMCQFYDPKAYNECREPNADRITEKEKANFCDYYKIGSSGNDPEKERQELLAKAQALFKK
jgi:hypothetical protein